MNETNPEKILKDHLVSPEIQPDGTAIVFQRHEKYITDRDHPDSGSLEPAAAEDTRVRDLDFFRQLLENEADAPVAVLFVSSDTQYNSMGRRSLETGQLAQDAAVEAMEERDIDPRSRILNFAGTKHYRNFGGEAGREFQIRPDARLREPNMLQNEAYLDYLIAKHNEGGQYDESSPTGLSQNAWAKHEADEERPMREALGAEGIDEVLRRTNKSMEILERFARKFHRQNPNTRLLIWVTSHYDTISPLVKSARGQALGDYQPVDYGAGVIINIAPNGEVVLSAQGQSTPMEIGRTAVLG